MEKYLESLSVPSIVAASYFIMKLIRYAVGKNEKFERLVPLISFVLGIALGIVCFYAPPAFIPAENVVVAIVIGGESGFSAIGTDVMFRQFGKKEEVAVPPFEKEEKSEKKTSDD